MHWFWKTWNSLQSETTRLPGRPEYLESLENLVLLYSWFNIQFLQCCCFDRLATALTLTRCWKMSAWETLKKTYTHLRQFYLEWELYWEWESLSNVRQRGSAAQQILHTSKNFLPEPELAFVIFVFFHQFYPCFAGEKYYTVLPEHSKTWNFWYLKFHTNKITHSLEIKSV